MSREIAVLKMRNLLLVTLPPDPDDEVIASVQEDVLQAMERYQPKGLVVDISTVDTVDSYFARTLAETANMVALMGGKTVIAGMRPNVAITTIQLGLTLGSALTALDVDSAADMLARWSS